MARLTNEEDDDMMKAVFNLCHMKHVLVDSTKDIQILEDTNRKCLSQISTKDKRKTLLIKEQGDECIVNVAQGLHRNQRLQQDPKRKALQVTGQEAIYAGQGLTNSNVCQGLFYGNYAPPNLPPVPRLRQFIEICSQPFEKQLTFSDVKDDQSRLAMSKEDVQKRLMPLLNENEDLRRGIQVTTYDLDGKEYPMVFKIWVEKIHVLTEGWKAFCHDHKLVEKQDFVTVWMFRNAATGSLCFVIDLRRLPVLETIKRRRTRRN
ncbi:putative transcription factor B3-Domain family [Rosa chinensis]|uniref:Putative transcription factor B3-Domain family n=1 Tax=Rosa chinensis TaxID=74649 RepID=A0A2P6P5L3_ROSCH|nr:uncharacterized protein LOC112177403 [Rosa chinensis]PRQ17221.1 putative transcription factor B3-Domain family [Rosa chinensis]